MAHTSFELCVCLISSRCAARRGAVMGEIDERTVFMAGLPETAAGEAVRAQVQAEVNERVRELHKIDAMIKEEAHAAGTSPHR